MRYLLIISEYSHAKCSQAILGALLYLLLAAQASAEVVYANSFENGRIFSLSNAYVQRRGELTLIGPMEGVQTYQNSRYSLRLAGNNIWNRFDLKLRKPLQLNQPVYLVCAIRSKGPISNVKLGLLIEGRSKPVFSETGPIGKRSVGRWERIVARLDQFAAGLEKKKLRGIRFLQRCAVGTELPGRTAPRHELFIDDVRILTGRESIEAMRIASEEAGVRGYNGPHKYTLFRSNNITIWHAPSIVPVLEETSPPERQRASIFVSSAKREGESFQIVLTPSNGGLLSFALKPAPLIGPGKSKIDVKNIKWHPVKYVPLKTRLGQSIEMSWPDPLSWDRTAHLENNKNAVFWVTINVPAKTKPGRYQGSITVVVSGAEHNTFDIPLELEVLPFELPFRPTFKTNQQLWGPKKGGKARPFLEELAARKMFDANLAYSDASEKKWRMNELGQNSIKINMVGGHGSKPIKLKGHPIYSSQYKDIFISRLKRNIDWLQKNRWSDKAFIFIWDENWGDQSVFGMVRYLVDLTSKVTNDIPVLAALPHHPMIDGKVDIYLAEYSRPEKIVERISKGDDFWRWGNVEMDLGKAPLSTRLSYGFQAAKLGYKGAYSWGVNAWKGRDPWTDFDKRNWSGSFFYPGKHIGSLPDRPVPSIRMELLRDGIEDFEYITILRKLIKERKSLKAKQAGETIQMALQWGNHSSENRRCDQDIDRFFYIREIMQRKISELINYNSKK